MAPKHSRDTAATLSDFQLFKVSSDWAEADDLAGKEPAKLAEMQSLLEQEYTSLLKDSHIWDTQDLKIEGTELRSDPSSTILTGVPSRELAETSRRSTSPELRFASSSAA